MYTAKVRQYMLSKGLTCFLEMALALQMKTVRAYMHMTMATGSSMAAIISTVWSVPCTIPSQVDSTVSMSYYSHLTMGHCHSHPPKSYPLLKLCMHSNPGQGGNAVRKLIHNMLWIGSSMRHTSRTGGSGPSRPRSGTQAGKEQPDQY